MNEFDTNDTTSQELSELSINTSELVKELKKEFSQNTDSSLLSIHNEDAVDSSVGLKSTGLTGDGHLKITTSTKEELSFLNHLHYLSSSEPVPEAAPTDEKYGHNFSTLNGESLQILEDALSLETEGVCAERSLNSGKTSFSSLVDDDCSSASEFSLHFIYSLKSDGISQEVDSECFSEAADGKSSVQNANENTNFLGASVLSLEAGDQPGGVNSCIIWPEPLRTDNVQETNPKKGDNEVSKNQSIQSEKPDTSVSSFLRKKLDLLKTQQDTVRTVLSNHSLHKEGTTRKPHIPEKWMNHLKWNKLFLTMQQLKTCRVHDPRRCRSCITVRQTDEETKILLSLVHRAKTPLMNEKIEEYLLSNDPVTLVGKFAKSLPSSLVFRSTFRRDYFKLKKQ